MKRYIYIILGIIVIAAIAIAVIFYLKNPSSSPSIFGFGIGGSLPQTGTQGNNSGQQGGATNGAGGNSASGTSTDTGAQSPLVQSFNVAANGPILNYFVDAKNTITAIKPDGTIISVAGEASSTLSSTAINGIIAAQFSYDGKKVLVSSGDSGNPKTNIFDVASKSWVSAPQGLQSPRWSPSNYQIAYLSQSGIGKLSLSTIDASNLKKAPVTLFSLHATDLTLQWASKNQFVLADKPSANNAGSIWVFDAQKNTLTPIVYETTAAQSGWGGTATGTLGLVFANDGRNSTLQLVASSGAVYHKLSFLTLPPKCSFATTSTIMASSTTSASYLFCGVPLDAAAFSSAQLSDSYNMMATFTSDQILRINIADGSWNILWNDPSQNMDVSDPKFFNNTLFFVNRYDQKLYALTLVSQAAQ